MYYKNGTDWDKMLLDELAYREESAEDEDKGYTKQELINLCNGKEQTAKVLFDMLSWQSPYTLLDEWEREGEIDEDYNIIKSE